MTTHLDEKVFFKILLKLGIKSKDKLLVSSNILRIIHDKKNKLNPEQIIKNLKKAVGVNGTLLFPTFNWDFCSLKTYDYNKTKSLAGALSNLCLKKKEFLKSINPIYSFEIFGKDKKKISNLKQQNCFGLNSPFGYLIKNQGKQLFIDLNYKEALTLVHVAEEKVKVEYRFSKRFTGLYVDKNKKKIKKTITMYSRKVNEAKSTIITKKFDLILKKNKALKTVKFKSSIFSKEDKEKAYNLMVKDIENREGCIIPEKV